MRKNTTAAEGRHWQQWTEAEARAALRDLAKSRMSAASFARARGIASGRLGYWTKRLAEAGPVSFVAVSLPAAASRATPTTERAHIEIAYEDVVLRVREDIDVEHLARIALALAVGARGC
jgi:hypothetical protein